MYKFAIFALALILSPVSGFTFSKLPQVTRLDKGMQKIGPAKDANLNMCPFCVQTLEQIIDQLIQIIANVGVIGGCAKLCGYLPAKIEQVACDLLCDYIGIEAFIALLQKADIDPIWMCELAHLCPVHDGGKAKITEFKVAPEEGPAGTTFNFDLVFQVLNETGTGEIELMVIPPDGLPFGDAVLNEGFKVGSYGVQFQLQAQPSEQEPFLPGNYKVESAICYGECGSKHEHSEVLDKGQTSFKITE